MLFTSRQGDSDDNDQELCDVVHVDAR
jgi:hypothetical protein